MTTEATPVQRTTGNTSQSKIMGETIPKNAPNAPEAAQRTIQLPIHFIKSSHFRVVHACGAWYGGDSERNLHLTFFNERTAIPKKMVLNVNEQGMIVGEDVQLRDSKEGVIREMEVDIIFSVPAAVEFYKTLGDNLKRLNAI
ncbi:MAG TPA: hypothetical protein VGO67_00685 [Verrucomicrobiae bacterium]